VSDFYLFETLLWESGKGYWLLDEHLERLEQSALFFSFNFPRDEVVTSLHSFEEKNKLNGICHRARLTLAKDGCVKTFFQPCDPPLWHCLPDNPLATHDALPCISLSTKKVDSSSPWFFHKTSKRDLFQDEFARAGRHSLFDIIFLNTQQEVTEGCITNLIVFLDGGYFTPPVSSGLLAGTMRSKLLSETSVPLQEKVLTCKDLQRARALFCCNSGERERICSSPKCTIAP
ncbi:aminotransferase class IV, partial [Desulfotalea psychrophila]|nr:aminotransferase class IV [Desulfotalea psychrophila]